MSNAAWMGSKYNFIKVPKKLVLERSSYEGLDSDAIFLYGYLFTKSQQSYSNKQYHDSYGVYVVDNFRQLFNWGKDLTYNKLKILEKLDLIKIRTSLKNNTRRVYVQDFNSDAPVTKYFSSQSVYNLQFFSIPSSLFFKEGFSNLSTDAVLLYGVLLEFLSISKLSTDGSYYDSELDAFYLTKDHAFFVDLFGWSARKYARVQQSLVESSLIIINRTGKGQRNRIYPVDFLSLTDTFKPVDNNLSDVNCHIDESDLPKSDTQNTELDMDLPKSGKGFTIAGQGICQNPASDLPKSGKGFAITGQGICQNPPRDLPKSDTNRLIFNSLSISNLNISNHIEELKNDSIGYINYFINSRNELKRLETKVKSDHTEALYFYMLDNLYAENLSKDQIELFIEYQMNFTDNYENIQDTIDNLKFDESGFNNAWINYYDDANRLLSKTKEILFKTYSKDPSVLMMFKNLGVNDVTTIKNLLKMSPDQLIGAVARVHNYFDFTKNVISNLDAFILKTLINVSSKAISFDNYYDYSQNLIHLIEQPKYD